MNLFTRICATMSASADKAVSQFENHLENHLESHEAIVDSSLLKARQAMANAKVRHAAFQRTGSDLKSRVQLQQEEIETWSERALRLACTDKARALECLAHRKHCEQTLASLIDARNRQAILEADMKKQLQTMQWRLQSMTRQCDEMRSRESVTRSNTVMNRIGPDGKDAVDADFERWESSISDAEIQNNAYMLPVHSVSSLDIQLAAVEHKEALEAELQDLINAAAKTNACI